MFTLADAVVLPQFQALIQDNANQLYSQAAEALFWWMWEKRAAIAGSIAHGAEARS